MSVYRVKPKPGEEPHKWKVEKFAEIGGDETFVRHLTELTTVLNATLIFDEQREDVNNAIMAILIDGLMPAFAELEKIRASHGKPLPMMDRRELYHDFCRKLWKAYKDLTQRAALVAGFNIGFLFTSDKDFAKGLKEFQANYPDVRPELGKSLEEARSRWQNELAKFRNTFLEHQDSDPKQFAKFYHPEYVEWLFDEVWNTIVDLMAVLLESRLPYGTKLALPDLTKNPQWPNRFVFDVPAFRNMKDR
jgi:hypothetical protein